jgi:hypothetical protein
MARPLPAHTTPSRNGSHGSVPSLAANLALARAEDDGAEEVPEWPERAAAPAGAPAGDTASPREQLAEANRLLAALRQEAEQALREQQAEFERILEEKSEIIRDLHARAAEGPARPAVPANVPREEELMALSEELERERRQLKEDEEALMEQMGHMEVQMSRERADLARQRTELQRLQSEIRHELELAARDAALRERLAPLQRRQQEIAARHASGTAPTSSAAAPPPEGASAEPAPGGRSSGIFRKIFG